jgi:hypothetical protein
MAKRIPGETKPNRRQLAKFKRDLRKQLGVALDAVFELQALMTEDRDWVMYVPRKDRLEMAETGHEVMRELSDLVEELEA